MPSFIYSFLQYLPDSSFDSRDSGCQGTSFHSCFTYMETRAQEGKQFTFHSHWQNWDLIQILPAHAQGYLAFILMSFTSWKLSWFGHWQSSSCFFVGLYIVNSDDEKIQLYFFCIRVSTLLPVKLYFLLWKRLYWTTFFFPLREAK